MQFSSRTTFPAVAAAAALLFVPVSAPAAEGTFDRNLTVNGNVTLNVSSGSGYIRIAPGADNQVHIVGHVKSSSWGWGMNDFGKSAEARVKEIVDNPPIDQTGNIIRVGKDSHTLQNVSIDYDIIAPKSAALTASSGSGDLRIDGAGVNAKLSTGSGSIDATGLTGNLSLETGSGNIRVSLNGSGDVKAQTGSGSIHLNNIQGALKAEAGSGSIEVSGKPTSGWKLDTGSGSVSVAAGGAAFTLDARTGSGSIKTDVPIAVEGSLDRHRVTGKVNGGGPLVRVETGSGSIRIH